MHSIFTHVCPKLKIILMSINEWMDKQTVVYLYNGILLQIENEWTMATHNMDEFHEHNIYQKKAFIKESMQHDSTYVNSSIGKANALWVKLDKWRSLGWEVRVGWRWLQNSIQELYRVMQIFCTFILMVITQLCTLKISHATVVQLNLLYFIVCKKIPELDRSSYLWSHTPPPQIHACHHDHTSLWKT